MALLDNPRLPHVLNYYEFLRLRRDKLKNEKNWKKIAKEMKEYFGFEDDRAMEYIIRYEICELFDFSRL